MESTFEKLAAMKRGKYENHLSFLIYFVIVFFLSWARVGVMYPTKSTHVLIPRSTCSWDVGPNESNPPPHLWYNHGLVLDHFILGSLINYIEGIRNILGAGIWYVDYQIPLNPQELKFEHIHGCTSKSSALWFMIIFPYTTSPTYHKAT
jgi:hypothetical protein